LDDAEEKVEKDEELVKLALSKVNSSIVLKTKGKSSNDLKIVQCGFLKMAQTLFGD